MKKTEIRNDSYDKTLEDRILEIAHRHKLSHLSSSLTAVGVIDKIYSIKKDEDIFILSCGHAALGLYVVLEKYNKINAEDLLIKHGTHPHRDEERGIYCSTGSLGMGITVAVGRALANKNRKVYVLISDGESAEGSVWESLRFIEESNVRNLEVFVNVNGYAAYDKVDTTYLTRRLKSFLPSINIELTNTDRFPFLKGLNGHYHIMTNEEYAEAIK
jgi:transketolase